MMKIWFDDRAYRVTHGRAPRGYGAWAFQFEGMDPVWAPSGTLTEAKRWVREHIRSIAPKDCDADVRVVVCT